MKEELTVGVVLGVDPARDVLSVSVVHLRRVAPLAHVEVRVVARRAVVHRHVVAHRLLADVARHSDL